MNSVWKKAGLGIALAATTLAAAAPAEAQRYGRGWRGGGFNRGNGGAVVAGIAGLAVGAALASNNNRFRGGYYDRGFYGPGPGYYDRGFYGPGPGFYNRGYYGPGPGFYDRGYYRGYQRCFTERRYDPYYGGPVRVRICR